MISTLFNKIVVCIEFNLVLCIINKLYIISLFNKIIMYVMTKHDWITQILWVYILSSILVSTLSLTRKYSFVRSAIKKVCDDGLMSWEYLKE